MSAFTTYAERLTMWSNISFQVFADIVNSDRVQDLARKLNEEQLDAGQRSDGSSLPPYSQVTVAIKQAKGQQTAPMNLKDTGDFRDQIRLRLTKNFGFLMSTDEKNEELKNRYGSLIFGLTAENELKVLNEIIRIYEEQAKKTIRR